MPFIALLIDALAIGSYSFQQSFTPPKFVVLGGILQAIVTILLLYMTIRYRGKKRSHIRPEGYAYLTIRYAIILFSFLINGLVLFLYLLYFLGINKLLFAISLANFCQL